MVTPLISSSNATKLAAQKTKLAQAVRDVQGKTSTGSLQQMMMHHFKDTTSHLWFYSLPLEIVKSLPMKEMSMALTSMLSIKGQPAQPAGTLPLEDEFHCLPLEDRSQPQPLQGLQASFLEAVEDDSMGCTPQAHERISGGGCDLQQLVDYCKIDGLLAFKIADKNPHLKKRVLGAVDNVTFADMAIRFYRAHSHAKDDELCISPMSNLEVPLVQFFAGKDPQKILDHMLCWRLGDASGAGPGTDEGFDTTISLQLKLVGRVFQQRLACPLTLQTIDVKRNIKPTPFELYLELSAKGWSWKTWTGKRADLKKLSVDLDPLTNRKVFYSGAFFYLLCLVTLPCVADKLVCKKFLMHGQLEAYYAAVFRLAQESRFEELSRLCPNQSAEHYRTRCYFVPDMWLPRLPSLPDKSHRYIWWWSEFHCW